MMIAIILAAWLIGCGEKNKKTPMSYEPCPFPKLDIVGTWTRAYGEPATTTDTLYIIISYVDAVAPCVRLYQYRQKTYHLDQPYAIEHGTMGVYHTADGQWGFHKEINVCETWNEETGEYEASMWGREKLSWGHTLQWMSGWLRFDQEPPYRRTLLD